MILGKQHIQLIGHAVLDTIYESELEPYQRWGGIYNVKRALNCLNDKIKVEVSPVTFGNAIIKINKFNSEKYPIYVNLGSIETPSIKHAFNTNFYQPKWIHFAYINNLHLDHKFFFKNNPNQIFSADLSKTLNNLDYINLEKLKDIDYLFCSIEEFDPKELKEKTNSIIIAHSPEEISIHQKEKETFSIKIIKERDLNVLGAGDYFAACVINGLISGDSLESCVKVSHLFTKKLLKLLNK